MGQAESTETVEELCRLAFGPGACRILAIDDVNRGRGAFSVVLRAELAWAGQADHPDRRSTDRPPSVVAKLPDPGPNGEAARASGAYRRESLAYREVLPHSPIAHPRAWAVVDGAVGQGPGPTDPGPGPTEQGADPTGDGSCSLLLEDLSPHRLPDQLDGLTGADAVAVAMALDRFHRAWDGPAQLLGPSIRRNTLAALPAPAIDAGLEALEDRWADVLDRSDHQTFVVLAGARTGLTERFATQPVTLCHGDPRADNLAFDRVDGHPILFDWQQMAVQFGEADLAWLAATSLTVETRRRSERDLVDAVGGQHDRYRLGLALPGLAVLLLAQRELPTERSQRFVATSLQRIAAALADNETARLG